MREMSVGLLVIVAVACASDRARRWLAVIGVVVAAVATASFVWEWAWPMTWGLAGATGVSAMFAGWLKTPRYLLWDAKRATVKSWWFHGGVLMTLGVVCALAASVLLDTGSHDRGRLLLAAGMSIAGIVCSLSGFISYFNMRSKDWFEVSPDNAAVYDPRTGITTPLKR